MNTIDPAPDKSPEDTLAQKSENLRLAERREALERERKLNNRITDLRNDLARTRFVAAEISDQLAGLRAKIAIQDKQIRHYKSTLTAIINDKVPGGQGPRSRGQFFYQDKLKNIQRLAQVTILIAKAMTK